ncbi:MAG: T9SS type A sorting domain-containing protein [Calditrichaceae bacterium]|nr:T9SS type A sorting domain-containing protein [Calditrichaceae bacterium]MBN2708468.1 T9SS type A sorting domain-containing protein [Calditrichaceae bacterium]RQV93081.1 MAG: T9SS C-terminal target domain-containing protein [Calditrichota bacterium]
MKKLTILLALLVFCGFTVLSAQPVEVYYVTFKVDMNIKMLMGEFDSLLQEVRMTGTLTSPNWDPPTAPILTDEDGDGIFQTTLQLMSGDYEYKYLIGDAWGNDESLVSNRAITVSGDQELDPVFYSNMSEPEFPAVGDGKIALRLNVNMSRQRQIGAFNPASHVVRSAGSFQGWAPADAPDMEDDDENLIYTVVYEVDTSETYEYKYLIGTDWGQDESSNRFVTVGVNDTAISPVYFNNEPYDPNFSPDSVNVTFQLDMSTRTLEGLFDPEEDSVVVAGSFNGWNNANENYFTDADEDTVYTGVWKIPGNQNIEYKFVINASTWESVANRIAVLGDADVVLPKVYFNNDSIVSQIIDGDIEFIVKMDVFDELGVFNNTMDSLKVRGDFNGWGDSDPTKSQMNQDFLDPNRWFLSVPFVQTPSDEEKLFKYVVVLNNPIKDSWTDGYERPCFHGGGNRSVTLDEGTAEHYYDDIHPDWVIEDDVYLNVNFRIDMRPAMDPLVQGSDLFDPATSDTLWYICEQPSWAAVMGWEDSDQMKYLYFTDDDNDSIYTATLTVNSAELSNATFNAFVYRYAFYDQSAGAWVSEPSGYSNFAYRTRYIGQNAARSFPVNPWPMPLDTWTNKEIKPDQETDPFKSYQDYVSIRPELPEGVINNYTLNQNYPNPFNPQTSISYSLPRPGQVSLIIYNVLGQKVKTLINGKADAGTHYHVWKGVDDRGNKVASGIYFYKLEAENFSAIKKMVLVK